MSLPRARKFRRYIAALDAEGLGALVPAAHREAAQACLDQRQDLADTPYLEMLELLAARAPGDFALRFGATSRLVDMGIVGHAIMSCETLRQALDIWSNFSGLSGDPFGYRVRMAGGLWINDVFPAAVMSPALLRFHAEEWIASFCHFATETTGARWTEAAIEFRHAPRQGVDYAALLPAAPQFERPYDRIALPMAYLDAPILSHDDETFALLVEHFAHRPPDKRPVGVAAQLQQLFFAAGGRLPKLAEAADRLGLSARTLNRRLAAEGTSYARVLDEYRSHYAQAMLRDGTLATKQIAHAIGYRNDQSLRRAFTAWTGKTIGKWRAEAKERHRGESPDWRDPHGL